MNYYKIAFVVFLITPIRSKQIRVSRCILEKTGSEGICKFLKDCPSVQQDVIELNILPQTCGFLDTQPIVCCPKDDKRKRKPGVVSRLKCEEYSSYAGKKSECGHNIVKRVVGGEKASKREFAHMAILGYDSKKNSVMCGGTIISENYILTAAYCLLSPTLGEYVKVGTTNINDTTTEQKLKISKIIIHSDYKQPSYYNDIGLIKLQKPIKFNSHARPACLYTNSENLPQEAVATGWGYTSYASGSTSNDLMKVTLPILDYDFCNMTYRNETWTLKNGIDEKSQICAGSGSQEIDTCQGDAGGPLQIRHENDDVECMYDVIGVTSFGKMCGVTPGVYTKVSHYIKWIEDIVWPIES